MKSEQEVILKLCVVGDSGVGKSSLIRRFCTDSFSKESRTTIGVDFTAKVVSNQNKQYRVQFWDLAGSDKFRNVVKLFLRGAAGIVFVASRDIQTSISGINQWLKCIKENCQSPSIKLSLLINKSDLDPPNPEFLDSLMKNREFEGGYFCSAASGHNVKEAFLGIINNVLDANPKQQKQTKSIGRQEPTRKNYYC